MRGFVGMMLTLVILVATAVAIAQPPGPGPDDYAQSAAEDDLVTRMMAYDKDKDGS